MIEIKAKVKKWGNSLGIIIPTEIIKDEHIKPEQEVSIVINPKRFATGKDIAGTWKTKKSTHQLMREIDKEMDFGF